ncbi:DoxX family membrane protein [Streptomyces sp. NPDC002276]
MATVWFASLGLRPAWLHARLAAGTEIVAGVLLGLGLLTGAACTAYVGLMFHGCLVVCGCSSGGRGCRLGSPRHVLPAVRRLGRAHRLNPVSPPF